MNTEAKREIIAGLTHLRLELEEGTDYPLGHLSSSFLLADVCFELGLNQRETAAVMGPGAYSYWRAQLEILAEPTPTGTWPPASSDRPEPYDYQMPLPSTPPIEEAKGKELRTNIPSPRTEQTGVLIIE